MRRGIVLAGGQGTRLRPSTLAVSKQLLNVYDKPMIYYPMSVLMLAGIRDILLISTPLDLPRFQLLFGDGERFGINISYAEQERANGLPEALIIGERFLDGEPSILILGDNLFFGTGLHPRLIAARDSAGCATIFTYSVPNPELYGAVEIDAAGAIIDMAEKPHNRRSWRAVTGLYFYDSDAPELARGLSPSKRGELEIMDLNRKYWEAGRLTAEHLGRGIAWLDSGSFDTLLDASSFIATVERRQGLKIACLEEIAWRNGWLTDQELAKCADDLANSPYGEYLRRLLA